MLSKSTRQAIKTMVANSAAECRPGVDRVSTAWRDAVGPGYATGVTENVARFVSRLDSGKYCH